MPLTKKQEVFTLFRPRLLSSTDASEDDIGVKQRMISKVSFCLFSDVGKKQENLLNVKLLPNFILFGFFYKIFL